MDRRMFTIWESVFVAIKSIGTIAFTVKHAESQKRSAPVKNERHTQRHSTQRKAPRKAQGAAKWLLEMDRVKHNRPKEVESKQFNLRGNEIPGKVARCPPAFLDRP